VGGGGIKLEFAELCNFLWKGLGRRGEILLEIVLILREPVTCPILMHVPYNQAECVEIAIQSGPKNVYTLYSSIFLE